MRHGSQTQFPADLSVRRRHNGDRPVLVVRGQIDLSTADIFRVAVEDVLRDQHRFELDLSNTTFMDSTALAVLIEAHRRLGQARESIVVRHPNPVIRRLLDVSGLADLLDVRTDDHPLATA